MRKRALLNGLLVVGLSLAAAPARSQLHAFRIPQPASTLAVGGRYLVQWDDRFLNELDPGCVYSVTWYYSASRSGEERRRAITAFKDDFSNGFRANWKPEGEFLFDWDVNKDPRDRRSYLVAPKVAGPAVSRDLFQPNAVLSVLVRPYGVRNEFAVGLRRQPNERAYELRNNGDTVRLVQSGRVLAERRLLRVVPSEWYWYEIGCYTARRTREVEIRVRVFDARREKVLVNFDPVYDRPTGGLDKGGLVYLTGPAHYAEVYVDPWEARWLDDRKNQFVWNTESVPDGDYYLIAELSDGRKAPERIVSDFQVQVRNRAQAAGVVPAPPAEPE
jgi:hypothetical protein